MPDRKRYRYFTLFTLERVEPQLAVCERQARQLKRLALDYGRMLVEHLEICCEIEFMLGTRPGDAVERMLSLELQEARAELNRLETEYRREIAQRLSKEQRHFLESFLAA